MSTPELAALARAERAVELTALEQQLETWVTEALALRFEAAEGPSADAGHAEALRQLTAVRARLDRLEALSGALLRARGRTRRAASLARAAADDAWDTALRAEAARPGRAGRDDFVAPRERYANANLATIHDQRMARAAERLASVAEDAYEVANMARRGLESLRSDWLAVLRGLTFENHLERSVPDRGY